MLQTKMVINASCAMRNDVIWPKFLFKSNTMQPCLSNYTISRVVQLKSNRTLLQTKREISRASSPPRKFSECAARFLIRPGLIQLLRNKDRRQNSYSSRLEMIGPYRRTVITGAVGADWPMNLLIDIACLCYKFMCHTRTGVQV